MTSPATPFQLPVIDDDAEFITRRHLNAPITQVWSVFTEAQHLARWWGPKGFEMFHCEVDFRPGGTFHYGLRAPNGMEIWGLFKYGDIVAPTRLDYVMSFSDAHGGITRNPWEPHWPVETATTVTLTEEDAHTLLTLAGRPINCTPRERDTFRAGHDSMTQGFGGTWDQLEAYLVSQGRP
ncbi:MAG: SRPBCC domain-containing protein [Rhodocyclaceae bacterium]